MAIGIGWGTHICASQLLVLVLVAAELVLVAELWAAAKPAAARTIVAVVKRILIIKRYM